MHYNNFKKCSTSADSLSITKNIYFFQFKQYLKKLEKTVESEFEIGNRHKRSSHEKVAMSKIPKFSKIFLEPEATLTKYEFLTKISRLPSQ